jgi:hypothetical protein
MLCRRVLVRRFTSFGSYLVPPLTNIIKVNISERRKYHCHYGTQIRCRRPIAVGTAKNVVGTVCTDGHRRHIAVGIGKRRHRLYGRRHTFSHRHTYRPTAMMSRRHNNAVGTGNFSYFFKKMNFQKNKKNCNFYFLLIFLKSL